MLIKHSHSWLSRFIEAGASTSILGFSRSILALNGMLKLMFNDINFIIPSYKLEMADVHSLKYRCNFFLLFNSSHLFEMQVAGIIILACVLSGYFMKVTALLHFWIAASFFMFRPITRGVENIDMLITLLLIPVCLFDGRKNHWHKPVTIPEFDGGIQKLFLLIIKLQVAFIYYDSLHDKLLIKEWLNGTVIYYWFTHNYYGLNPSVLNIVQPILTCIPVLLILSWGTMLFEALLAIGLLFNSRFKLVLLKCGIIFHFGIFLVHGFSSLFLVMSAALLLYLYPANKPCRLSSGR